MKVSPVQLGAYLISRVSVEPREPVSLTPIPLTKDDIVDWQGVNLQSNVEFGWGDGQGDNPRAFVVRLRLRIANESGKPAPYNVDLESVGYFELLGEIPLEDREGIAKVNGASLLFSALRELLFSLTTRFPKGPLVLPSVNFHDLKERTVWAPANVPASISVSEPQDKTETSS